MRACGNLMKDVTVRREPADGKRSIFSGFWNVLSLNYLIPNTASKLRFINGIRITLVLKFFVKVE